jgi:hypothetical protein
MLKNLSLALTEALQDEYKAQATYRAILQRFGPVRPFANIVKAEERHIQALLPLFARYGIPVPADDWPTRVTVPDSVAQACQEGVQAEIDNGAMYERLLAMTADYPDVQRVFRNLQRASQENHLPAFQRWAARAIPAGLGSTWGEPAVSAEGRAGHWSCGNTPQGPRMGDASAMVNQAHGRRRRHQGGR